MAFSEIPTTKRHGPKRLAEGRALPESRSSYSSVQERRGWALSTFLDKDEIMLISYLIWKGGPARRVSQ